MDKENKEIVTASTASYDPDAAELLKDLDEDDEDDYEPVMASSQAHRSIVNILTSNNMETLATIPSLPVVPLTAPAAASMGLASATDLAAPSHESTAESNAVSTGALNSTDSLDNDDDDDDDNGEDTVVMERSSALSAASPDAESSAPSTDSAQDSQALVSDTAATSKSDTKAEDPKTESPKQPLPPVKSDTSDDAITVPDSAAKSPIKPFEPAKKEPQKPSADEKSEKHQDKPIKEDRDEGDTGSEKAQQSNKRPPVPPPKTGLTPAPVLTPASAGSARVLRDNEVVLTAEAINDMLPGGKNDEARDLAALKFNDNNWYSQVFNEDFFRTIPKSSPRQTVREAKFIIDRLGIESGARVLDLCCGFGRHTLQLAAKGFDMVGLDLSMVMLKKALADAQAKGQAIKFIHGDMRKLTFKAIFDAIYNVQTSFGYFDDLSNFKVLQGIFNALKPGGVFLIETVNRDFLVNDLPLRLWWKGQDCMLLEEIDLDQLSGVLKVVRSFVFDDNSRAPWEQKINIRLYTANEMRALLMRAGFRVVELSGDYSLPGAYFGATSPKNIFVAEKPVK